MTRPIKFRWRDYKDGRIRYAYFFLDFGGKPRIHEGHIKEDLGIALDREWLAQLVGYDSAGNEIYEGDKVISEYGDEVVARLMDNLPPKAKLKLSEDTK